MKAVSKKKRNKITKYQETTYFEAIVKVIVEKGKNILKEEKKRIFTYKDFNVLMDLEQMVLKNEKENFHLQVRSSGFNYKTGGQKRLIKYYKELVESS